MDSKKSTGENFKIYANMKTNITKNDQPIEADKIKNIYNISKQIYIRLYMLYVCIRMLD